MRKWAILWVVSIGVAMAISAGVTVRVQSRVLSGDDVGFRVEGVRSERRTDRLTGQVTTVDVLKGNLVVRLNGQWMEAEFSGPVARPATN
jgi:hypothetical protein